MVTWITIWVLGSQLVAMHLVIMSLPFAVLSAGFPRRLMGKPAGKFLSCYHLLQRWDSPTPILAGTPFRVKGPCARGGELLWRAAEMEVRSELYSCSSLEESLSMHGKGDPISLLCISVEMCLHFILYKYHPHTMPADTLSFPWMGLMQGEWYFSWSRTPVNPLFLLLLTLLLLLKYARVLR